VGAVAVLEGGRVFRSKKPDGFSSSSRSDDLSEIGELGVPAGVGPGVGDEVTTTAAAGVAGRVVSGRVIPGDAGPVHPAVRTIPGNKKTRRMVLIFISTGYPAGADKLTG
jgi:hypothetical protein